MATFWTALALMVSVFFLIAVVRWDRRPGPSNDDVTPSQPPADAGAEGMRVAGRGEIAPGSEQRSN